MNTILSNRQPRDWWNTVTLGVVAVIAFLMIWMNACSSASPASKTNNTVAPVSSSAAMTKEQSVPASLANAGEYGENIYDFAKANDWKNANVKLAALKGAVKNVRTDVKNGNAAVDGLEGNVA